jgi:hypothetical protein
LVERVVWDHEVAGSNPVTPTMSGDKEMKLIRLIILTVIGGGPLALSAQEAAPPDVDLTAKKTEQSSPVPNPSAIPELSQLDEIFKQTSLGQTADEFRMHAEWRRLRNQVANNPDVIAAKKAAESARTDLQKREWLRRYYNIYYAHMQALADRPEIKAGLADMKARHLALSDQPRVRPSPAPAPSAIPMPSATAVPSAAEQSEH